MPRALPPPTIEATDDADVDLELGGVSDDAPTPKSKKAQKRRQKRRSIAAAKAKWSALPRGERFRIAAVLAGLCALVGWLVGVVLMLQQTIEAKELRDTNINRYELLVEARGENPTQTRVLAAIIGYYLGPLLLLYGYQIPQLIIVMTALISSGVAHYAEEIEHMEQLNAQAAAGRIMPYQVAGLAKLLLSTFTTASAEMKIPAFDALIKGAVCANIVVDSIVKMLPKGEGCMCGAGADIECSPVNNAGMYAVELRCYDDRWGRFLVRWGFVLVVALLAVMHRQLTFRLNPAVLGANLMCQAIFDTVLAVLPAYGARVQPYRLFGIILFAGISTRVHFWMEQFDKQQKGALTEESFQTEITVLPLLLPTLRLLHRVGVLFMFPLRMLDQLCDGLRTFGQRDLIVEELEKREFHASMKEDLERRCPAKQVTKQDLENMRELSEELVDAQARIETIDRSTGLVRAGAVALNGALLALAAALCSAAIHYGYDPTWAGITLVPPRVVKLALATAVLVAAVALLGVCGAQSSARRRALSAYSVLLAICFLLSAFGSYFSFASARRVRGVADSAAAGGITGNVTAAALDARVDDVVGLVHEEFLAGYGGGACSIADHAAAANGSSSSSSSSSSGLAALPALGGAAWLDGAMGRTSCAQQPALQSLIRQECAFYNRSDADELQHQEQAAYKASDWARYMRLKTLKNSVLRQSLAISSCIEKYNVSTHATAWPRPATAAALAAFVTPAAEHGPLTYCLCRSSLAERIYGNSRTLAWLTLAALAVEFALLWVSLLFYTRSSTKMKLLETLIKLRKRIDGLDGDTETKKHVFETVTRIKSFTAHAPPGDATASAVAGVRAEVAAPAKPSSSSGGGEMVANKKKRENRGSSGPSGRVMV